MPPGIEAPLAFFHHFCSHSVCLRRIRRRSADTSQHPCQLFIFWWEISKWKRWGKMFKVWRKTTLLRMDQNSGQFGSLIQQKQLSDYSEHIHNLFACLVKQMLQAWFLLFCGIDSKFAKWRPSSSANCGAYVVPLDCTLGYIEQAGKELKVRVQWHRDAVRLYKWENALCIHVFKTKYTLNWSSARLMFRSSNEFKWLTVESSLKLNLLSFNIKKGFRNIIDNFFNKIFLDSKSFILK